MYLESGGYCQVIACSLPEDVALPTMSFGDVSRFLCRRNICWLKVCAGKDMAICSIAICFARHENWIRSCILMQARQHHFLYGLTHSHTKTLLQRFVSHVKTLLQRLPDITSAQTSES